MIIPYLSPTWWALRRADKMGVLAVQEAYERWAHFKATVHLAPDVRLVEKIHMFLPPLISFYWKHYPEMMRLDPNLGVSAAFAGIGAHQDPDIDREQLLAIHRHLLEIADYGNAPRDR